MGIARHLWLALAIWLTLGGASLAEARLDPEASTIRQGWGGGIDVALAVSEPVPWRARLLADPPRLILDFRGLALDGGLVARKRILGIEAGTVRPGWSRIVMTLNGPYAVDSAEMRTKGDTSLHIALSSTDEETFRRAAAVPEPPEWTLPAALPPATTEGDGPLLVMLDPGHGGLDPGAQYDGLREKTLTLTFAEEFKQVLLRDGRFRVALTRTDDRFVPLESRITLARAAGADIFISLHADAVAEGEATGTTLYTLSETATDRAARILAQWHDRTDILAGVDLEGYDDAVARVLMDMARAETTPRTARLASSLERAIKAHAIPMHPHAHQQADFAVLKAPEMPSVLVELGFLSSESDRAKLRDPAWRARMAQALRDGLVDWADRDAAIRPGLRR